MGSWYVGAGSFTWMTVCVVCRGVYLGGGGGGGVYLGGGGGGGGGAVYLGGSAGLLTGRDTGSDGRGLDVGAELDICGALGLDCGVCEGLDGVAAGLDAGFDGVGVGRLKLDVLALGLETLEFGRDGELERWELDERCELLDE